ncbi:zinc ribbon domain-containing protein [Roseisolibacter sp. H3M3-2]|uniref:FmdB family zinc ribbon protein n=1 Tax=Roseisolibacter sp. H3M3-2 TaxID=3031323 RepID=UPI0023DB9957|nr:zinc ribbon domain-containing protein [Roseisolibacter sp. H3M3-2]MDF1506217.1 zinc ribbon domain-containing protein [Roseisolibacter sp. H3M3-2]
MPLYDFRCLTCDAENELLVRGSAPPACPACGGANLERLVSLPAIRSETTRDVMMRGAKKRDAAQAKDRINQQAAYERNHD